MHATATSPLGPFENATVAVPNWATQPQISYDPSTGMYVLLHSRYDSVYKRTRGAKGALACTVDGRQAAPPIGFNCPHKPCQQHNYFPTSLSKFGPRMSILVLVVALSILVVVN